MKINFVDDKMVVYLSKAFTEGFDINNEKKLEQYFKELFLKLKKRYGIELSGYYIIDVYCDELYGMILEIENTDIDYYNYFSQIDMKINVLKNSSFLYEMDYCLLDFTLVSKGICYKNRDKIYLEIKEDIDEISLGKILERSKIIYGEKKDEIVKYGKRVKI